MAKAMGVTAVLVVALCFSSFLGYANGKNNFKVQGQLYCDTCRVEFITRLSEPLPDSTVAIQCKNRTTEVPTFNVTAKTDSNGYYNIVVEGDHEEEICEVVAVSSSRADCQDRMDMFERARVLLTDNVGITEKVRYANPIGFLKKVSLADCVHVLRELGL